MKQVTAILLGAGSRGVNAYASYALAHPDELRMVGVAEPREEQREAFRKLHNIPPENSVATDMELLERPRMADCVMICTQDQMHYRALKKAMERGYHILCEKPISPDLQELEEIRDLANKYDKVFSICHVLRYSPFFREIKKLLDQGAIGQLIDIQHIESVGYWHMAHSFVRGSWRNKELSSPMILQKCCHDMDILLWLAGASCVRLSSFGSLTHFREENAPEGAPDRCLDGCSHQDTCPYNAPRYYLTDLHSDPCVFAHVVSSDGTEKSLLEALKTGPYGRCVYHCDNNVVDHQIVNLQFSNGVTASLTMCAFTDKCERILNLMGTHGQIKANMEENTIHLADFASGNETTILVKIPRGGHSGSDVSMMKEFVRLVAEDGRAKSITAASESIESHLMALAAEDSRLHNGAVRELQ